MHEVDGGVVADFIDGAIPEVEFVEEPLIDGFHRDVVGMHFFLQELLNAVLADLVAEERFLSIALRLDQFSVFCDEFVE